MGLDGYHLSFFEMMGNFSIGQYFKEARGRLAWEFLFERLKIDEDRLWVSVFGGDAGLGLGEDEVAIEAWVKVGLPRERIVGLPRAENFWQAGEIGPCGPCSEMYCTTAARSSRAAARRAARAALRALSGVLEPRVHGVRPPRGRHAHTAAQPVIDTGLGLERPLRSSRA